ncbi:MAG: glycosyltransferase, partial [Lentisphaerae bacterium]|nr:glycosyltransferase [Lentisphaerota bacterium]
MYFLKLPWLLLVTLWRHGVPATLAVIYDVVVRRRMAPGIRFPHESPSNASAYLPLLKFRPRISIIMPVYNSRWLAQASDTVLKQSYDNLELVLVDDCSTDPQTLSELQQLSQQEKVILLKTDKNLGISGATNLGLARASGEFIGFMDHDDLLHHDALALLVRALNQGVTADVFFTDEARMDQRGFVNALMRKSLPSLDLLLSCNAVLHFCVVSRQALERLGQ